ncbi:hypothetical protein CYCD_21530 [Tenuifilaceae bacterium CYCD]|nr:hypothetical protein CYCD_21530 [Tenuifilaceae bacterium CYCD]
MYGYKNQKNRKDDEVFIGNVKVNYDKISGITIVDKYDKTLQIKFDGKMYLFQNIEANDSLLKFEAMGYGRKQTTAFSIIDPNHNFSDFLCSLETGQTYITNSKDGGISALFVFACLLANAIDNYCDEMVRQNVATCTKYGRCSVVESCGASCVGCK